MGAYSPVSLASQDLLDRTTDLVFRPVLDQMQRDGTPYSGVLYAGLMVTASGAPRVVEFNCRFGDPETQVILPLIEDGLTECMERVARGATPSTIRVQATAASVTTVLASRGYPDQPEKGAAITIPDELPEGVTVFQAGTRRDHDEILRVDGGRVLAVTAVAPVFAQAQQRSRAAAESIRFEGKIFRSDIGWREAGRVRHTAGWPVER
jgi:phosphoribosylamine--glycine ligase